MAAIDDSKYNIGVKFDFYELKNDINLPLVFINASGSMTFRDVFEYAREKNQQLPDVDSHFIDILFENRSMYVQVILKSLRKVYVYDADFDMTLYDFKQQQKMSEPDYYKPLFNDDDYRPSYLTFVLSLAKKQQPLIESAQKTAAALLKRFDGDIESAAQMMAKLTTKVE